jgi:hypothetical protein
VETNPVLPFANFGAAPLQYFAVTFDQSNQLIKLESKDKTLTLAAPRRPDSIPAPTPIAH